MGALNTSKDDATANAHGTVLWCVSIRIALSCTVTADKLAAQQPTLRISCGSQTVPFGSTFSLLSLVLHFELLSISTYGNGPPAPAPCNARCSMSSRRARNDSAFSSI